MLPTAGHALELGHKEGRERLEGGVAHPPVSSSTSAELSTGTSLQMSQSVSSYTDQQHVWRSLLLLLPLLCPFLWPTLNISGVYPAA